MHALEEARLGKEDAQERRDHPDLIGAKEWREDLPMLDDLVERAHGMRNVEEDAHRVHGGVGIDLAAAHRLIQPGRRLEFPGYVGNGQEALVTIKARELAAVL